MKRIIAIVAILAAFITGAKAQSQYTAYTMVNVKPSGVTVARDTTSNTDTSYLYFATGGAVTALTTNNDVIVRWTNTNVSGTTGGSVIFQGSPTGTFTNTTGDWSTLINDKTQSLITDTVTVSGTTSATFIIRSCPYKYIRARYISSGTQTSALTGTAWIRPRQ